ncbi:hypothetical protein [Bosea vaviloviae]|uniref:hypothetical protein n=1 Tax=Bosea vaviloviae TaxID=1526658 RepID=UPI0013146D5C|nr:hypothetical protein [Bosea vaviloviae]
MTEVELAQAFGISRRTVQNWSAKGPPAYIAELLQLALSSKVRAPTRTVSINDVDDAAVEEAAAALSPALNSLIKSACSAGWSDGIVAAAMRRWLEER